jgi:acetyl/propionyl-CoA carboxylase alpha subunit
VVIEKLLVANRGEIARRIFRTARRLGIRTVAVYSEPEAPFVREADEAVRIESYLRGEELVAAAARTGADAVHPGYGFLSEDAGFARRCVDAGLTWVGPPPAVVELAGSKLRARELARANGIPVLEDAGFPALVKASAGGGGRGMRIVHSEEELAAARESAAREAEAAFGDGTLYVERFVPNARHVEVQILADAHGNVTHLYGRDCTVQRRWQKVIEEGPFTDERILAAAIRLAQAMNYENAGTVEFLLAPEGEFFFLEVNARLQVEHPVTEEVTGIDLVELQLRIAEGSELPRHVTDCYLHGYAVEARLYAESAGTITRFEIDGVRVDSAVEAGSHVGSSFDPMIAKLVAHAPTRGEAIRALTGALRRARIHGIDTNRDLLLAALEHPDLHANQIDTQWLERLEPTPRTHPLHALAAALAGAAARRSGQTLPSGWRNNPSQLQRTSFDGYDVGYRLQDARFEVNGDPVHAQVVKLTPERIELEVDGILHGYDTHIDGPQTHIDSPDGSITLHELDRYPTTTTHTAAGSLVSPMPGSIIRIPVAAGQDVQPGQPLVILEAMKMEHTITAPHAGRITEIRVAEGEQVGGGHVLVVLEEPAG